MSRVAPKDDAAPLRVLVTDGEQRAALAVVRSLGRAGHQVLVTSASGRSLAGASRYCLSDHKICDALVDRRRFAAAIRELVAQCRIDVLLPITEASLLAILAERELIPDVRIPFPDLATFRRGCDKQEVLKIAADIGIAVPPQEIAHSEADVRRIATDPGWYPLVLKPSRSVGEAKGRWSKVGVRHVASRAELEKAPLGYDESAYPLLVQRRIEGHGMGVFMLVWNGTVRALFAHRRLREKPPSGGVSVYSESVAPDPAIVTSSVQLLTKLNWSGVAMLEYKVDRRTGVPYLMEINPRFWGSLQLAIDAGVDFPRLLVDLAAGQSVAPTPPFRVGIRSRWWWGDVDYLLLRLRHDAAELSLPSDAGSRTHAVLRFLRWERRDRNEVLRIDDPRPFLRETALWFSRR